MPPYDWANGGSAYLFFGGEGPGGKYGFSNMGVGDILRSGCGIQG